MGQHGGVLAVPFRVVLLAMAGLLLSSVPAIAQRISAVEPRTAKIGDLVRVKGESLGPAIVDELYLTNNGQDVKIVIIQQAADAITFKIPDDLKPGRWALMIHLKEGTGTRFFEQPIKITVE